ncbi:matrix remodeling-associated protein 8-like [Scleropages formosus]|uniref:matrix remodeling-associated protein 8-like n=1 Tax=Scleropages formosus TaxID=113540 RepID=UPI0010FA88F0|nr:matrix remodeling-associated protein 8-like [Scleropages formosus]XP_018600500.2 matrix remodeling-associated protein 8-like [Scleropages formosus]
MPVGTTTGTQSHTIGWTTLRHYSTILKGDSFDVKDFKMDPDTFFTVLIITCVQLSESNGLEPVTADVKSSALLPCTGTAHRGQAEVKWTSSGDPVFVYHQGKLTTGPGFKNRVHLSKEEIEGGNFSLIISPVEYSDKGLYSCFYNNEWLHDVRLDVVVPTVVSVPVGDPVKLHCYADINRQIEDSQLDVRWEKEGKLVLHLHHESVTLGSKTESMCLKRTFERATCH